jgi:hypothetical protein
MVGGGRRGGSAKSQFNSQPRTNILARRDFWGFINTTNCRRLDLRKAVYMCMRIAYCVRHEAIIIIELFSIPSLAFEAILHHCSRVRRVSIFELECSSASLLAADRHTS